MTAFTVAPEAAPDWARDPEQLWNAVEAKENRKNSQLAFEWLAALPNELDDAQRENIARDFAGWLVDEYGVAVTVGIHNGGNRGNGLNDHMHVLMTTRPLDENGWARNKLRPSTRYPACPTRRLAAAAPLTAPDIRSFITLPGFDYFYVRSLE